MKITKLTDYKAGWFVGNFEPTAHKTKDFEVGTTIHPKGSEWPKHYHKKSREINYLIRGKMLIQDQEIVGGDVFVFEPYEVADPIFLEDCEVLVIKTPSVPGDKFECE